MNITFESHEGAKNAIDEEDIYLNVYELDFGTTNDDELTHHEKLACKVCQNSVAMEKKSQNSVAMEKKSQNSVAMGRQSLADFNVVWHSGFPSLDKPLC
jgi:hypothetical protein